MKNKKIRFVLQGNGDASAGIQDYYQEIILTFKYEQFFEEDFIPGALYDCFIDDFKKLLREYFLDDTRRPKITTYKIK